MGADKSNPLEGRTVMITRAREQAVEFAAELEAYGARVVACPTIEIVPPTSYAQLDEAIENLFGYDWLVLTSVNAVEHFLARLEAAGKDVSELDGLRVCAIGEATAAKLFEAHVHVDVIPEKSRAEGVFEALEAYLGGREQFENLNFLLPRAAVARDFLPRSLEAARARCDVVEASRTVRRERPDRARAATPTAPPAPRGPPARAPRRCSSAAALISSPSPAPRPCTTSRSSSTRAPCARCSRVFGSPVSARSRPRPWPNTACALKSSPLSRMLARSYRPSRSSTTVPRSTARDAAPKNFFLSP